MNTTLRQYVDALLRGTRFNENTDVPHILRQVNPTLNMSYTMVVSDTEPFDRVLPLNVVWLCMTKNSPMFRQLLARESKDKSEAFEHTWTRITEFNQLWASQIYDPADVGLGDVELATTTAHGIAKLSHKAAFDSSPRFVSTTDPRNTDARYPNYHTHAEKPAVRLKHEEGPLNIDAVVPDALPDGNTLVGVDESTVTHARVKLATINME